MLESLLSSPPTAKKKDKKAEVQDPTKSSRRCCQGEQAAAGVVGSANPEQRQLLLCAGFLLSAPSCMAGARQGNVLLRKTCSPIVLVGRGQGDVRHCAQGQETGLGCALPRATAAKAQGGSGACSG